MEGSGVDVGGSALLVDLLGRRMSELIEGVDRGKYVAVPSDGADGSAGGDALTVCEITYQKTESIVLVNTDTWLDEDDGNWRASLWVMAELKVTAFRSHNSSVSTHTASLGRLRGAT